MTVAEGDSQPGDSSFSLKEDSIKLNKEAWRKAEAHTRKIHSINMTVLPFRISDQERRRRLQQVTEGRDTENAHRVPRNQLGKSTPLRGQ